MVRTVAASVRARVQRLVSMRRCAASAFNASGVSRSGSIEIISTRRSARVRRGARSFSVARSVSMMSGQAAGQLP